MKQPHVDPVMVHATLRAVLVTDAVGLEEEVTRHLWILRWRAMPVSQTPNVATATIG